MSSARLVCCLLWLASGLACSSAEPVAPIGDKPPVTPVPPAVRAATVEALEGTVSLEHQGVLHPVQGKASLTTGDAVETGETGRARLTLIDGRMVELGPDGRFEVTEDGAGTTLTVAKGLVLTRLAGSADAGATREMTLTISTPFGLTRIGAAEASVRVAENAIELDVKVGELEVLSKDGVSTRLQAGEHSRIGVTRELPMMMLAVTQVAGRVELKAKDTPRFVPVGPKGVESFGAGDALRVVRGRAVVAANDSKVRVAVSTGAELVLAGSQRLETGEALSFDLQKGELQVQAPEEQMTRVEVGGVALISAHSAQYAVRRGAKGGIDVSTLIGDLTVQREGSADELVPGGSTAHIGEHFEVIADTREVLQLPSRSGLRVFHPGELRAALTWDGSEGTTAWRVEVATDASAPPHLSGIVHQPFLNVPIPARGTLVWRVFEGDSERAHGQASFAPEQGADLSRIKNLVRDGPETTTILFQDKPPTLTLMWLKTDGAARYRVRAYRDGDLATALLERTTSELQVVLPESTFSEGHYRWSVTPLDASGAELAGGRMNRLNVEYDNAVTQLVLKSPANGEVVKDLARVVGVAPLGSKVLVNGREAGLDPHARFESSVKPLSGRIVVRCLTASAETITVRRIRR